MPVVRDFKTKKLAYRDHDEAFHNSPSSKVILNDLVVESEKEREALEGLLMSTYNDTDVMDSTPACVCGALTSYSEDYVYGVKCARCKSPVVYPEEVNVESNVWVRHPLKNGHWLNPLFWDRITSLLQGTMSTERFSAAMWLIDTSVRLPRNTPKTMRERIKILEDAGWVRTQQYLKDNVDQFFELMGRMKSDKSKFDRMQNEITTFLRETEGTY